MNTNSINDVKRNGIATELLDKKKNLEYDILNKTYAFINDERDRLLDTLIESENMDHVSSKNIITECKVLTKVQRFIDDEKMRFFNEK